MTIFWSPSGHAFEFGKKVPFTDPRIVNDPRAIAGRKHEAGEAQDDFGMMEDDGPTPDTPDLGDLIPGNDTGGARVGDVRPREPGPGDNQGRNVVPRAGNMADVTGGARDGDVEMGEAAALRAGGGGPGGGVSKETPISSYPGLTYGLQETHTTVLPWVGWLTAGGLDKETPLQLKIRMNTPWDFLDMTTASYGATDGAKILTKGFYSRGLDKDGRITTASLSRYPVEFGDGAATANERPQWREFWTKLYDYYTVLGCEYEVILFNPLEVKQIRPMIIPTKTIATVVYPSVIVPVDCGWYNTDVVVATQFDTYSDTATSTGNVMPLTYYEEVRAFKNIKWTPVKGGQKAIIKGTYKPGQAARNIVNDGDVKTWTACGATLPNLKEILTLNFFADPFFNARQIDRYETAASIEPNAGGASMTGTVNMEIKLKWIVQFKDLKQQARYPNTITSDQDITLILDENKSSSGSALMSWTTAST